MELLVPVLNMLSIELNSFIYHLQVEKSDRMPQKICAVCISYMKHAIMFRKQVINNIMFVKNGGQKLSVLNNCTSAAAYNRADGYEKVDYDNDNGFGNEIDNVLLAEETFDDLKHELDLAFGGPCDSSDDEDDSDANGVGSSNDPAVLFSYTEKRFTEDDILDIGDGCGGKILITEPDEMRERKCDACRKRFMLKESFEQHLKECIELKLLTFIIEGYQLVGIRRSRSLSAHEFVRRNIFSLKKLIKSLALCYKEVTDVTMTNDDINNVLSKNSKLDELVSNNLSNLNSVRENLNNLTESAVDGLSIKDSLNLLQGKQNILIRKNQIQKTPIPRPMFDSTNDIGSAATNNGSVQFPASKNLLRQLVPNMQHSARIYHSSPIETMVALCSPCGQSFTSLGLFEEHNRQFHNTTRSTPSIASNGSSTSTPPELNLSTLKHSTNSADILNADERNTLLERLASRSIKF